LTFRPRPRPRTSKNVLECIFKAKDVLEAAAPGKCIKKTKSLWTTNSEIEKGPFEQLNGESCNSQCIGTTVGRCM